VYGRIAGTSGSGYQSARGTIEVVTDRTAWPLDDSKETEMAQGLSVDLRTDDGRTRSRGRAVGARPLRGEHIYDGP
jgi:hypothetical protein